MIDEVNSEAHNLYARTLGTNLHRRVTKYSKLYCSTQSIVGFSGTIIARK